MDTVSTMHPVTFLMQSWFAHMQTTSLNAVDGGGVKGERVTKVATLTCLPCVASLIATVHSRMMEQMDCCSDPTGHFFYSYVLQKAFGKAYLLSHGSCPWGQVAFQG